MGKGVDRQSFAIYREGGVRRGSLAFLNFLGVPYQQNYIIIELRNAIFIHYSYKEISYYSTSSI